MNLETRQSVSVIREAWRANPWITRVQPMFSIDLTACQLSTHAAECVSLQLADSPW